MQTSRLLVLNRLEKGPCFSMGNYQLPTFTTHFPWKPYAIFEVGEKQRPDNFNWGYSMKKPFIASVLAGAILLGTPAMFPNTTFAATVGEIENSVSLRTGPSTSDERIRYLREGEEVTILEKTNSYWYKVRDRYGNVGYTSTSDKYISVSSSNSTVSSGSSESVGEIVRSVSMRTGPGTDYNRIRYAQTGERVTILEQPNRYWYKIRDRYGDIGYISSSTQYINVSGGSAPAPKPQTSSSSTVPLSAKVEKLVSVGKSYLGTPYEFGSSRYDNSTFDCSDFVKTVFREALGITLPSDSRKQGEYIKNKGNIKTSWEDLEPGDIMFFMSYRGSSPSDYKGVDKLSERITHNGIYIGDGKILHTYSKESGGVRIDVIDGRQWENRFLFGGSAF